MKTFTSITFYIDEVYHDIDLVEELQAETKYEAVQTARELHRKRCLKRPPPPGILVNEVLSGTAEENGTKVTLNPWFDSTYNNNTIPIQEKPMEIKEIRLKRAQLNMRIAREVQHALAEFEKETGVFPSSVDIHIVEIQSIGKPSTYEVACVTTDICL